MPRNDIYEISGRIKNIIANEDIALSPVGVVLVNYFALMLKDLYDYADQQPNRVRFELTNLLLKQESVPMRIIQVSTPKEQPKTLYEQVMEARDTGGFRSLEELLEDFTRQYEDLGARYDKTGNEFWLEAESGDGETYDHKEIMRLQRKIQMCRHLLEKEKSE